MNRKRVDQLAKRLYEHIIGQDDFDDAPGSVKALYRKIARRHLEKLNDEA